MVSKFRHTRIIFTVGPATEEGSILQDLIDNGVDICRLNMAHATPDWTRKIVNEVKKASRRANRHIALLMDIKGPEIRTGVLEEDFVLEIGETFDFLVGDATLDEGIRGVSVNYPNILNDVSEGDCILVDSGLLRLKVMEVMADRFRCEVVIGGILGSRRHINLPGVHINLPSLTEKDKQDILLGIELDIDFYALSFVRSGDDLHVMRRFVSDNGSKAPIIAKIEDQSAVHHLEEIISASDGLMVARGDLGIEIPFEDLPQVQRQAVNACVKKGKPVIIATHMLESMIQSPIPTRAEITDVSNAVLEGADCVMLSGETTVGKYPIQCVDVMNRIIRKTESQTLSYLEGIYEPKTVKGKMLHAAVKLARDLGNVGILIFTRRGLLPQELSSMRAKGCPVYAFTDRKTVFRKMMLLWGIEPFYMNFDIMSPENTIKQAMVILQDRGWVHDMDRMIVISKVQAGDQIIDTIQIRRVSHFSDK